MFGLNNQRFEYRHHFVAVTAVLTLVVHYHVVTSQFPPLEIRKTIKEELLPGYVIANLSTEPDFVSVVNDALNSGAISKNSSSGSSLHYSILTTGNIQSQYFVVDPYSGVVSLKRNIDRERVCSFREECHLNFQTAARSVYGGFFHLINFHIVVTDINDNPPEFTQIQFELNIPENAEVGRSFQLPTAFDRDTGVSNRVQEYRVLDGSSLFGLKTVQTGPNSSDIFLTLDKVLAQENAAVYKVLVGAIDGGIPSLTGTLTVDVYITDVNDNFPVFEFPEYVKKVPEISGIDHMVVQVHATDNDSGRNGEVTYTFSAQQPQDDLNFFRVDTKTGQIFLTKSIEAKAGATIDLLIEAKDGGHPPKTSRTLVTIEVDDTINSVADIIVDTLGGSNEGVAEVSEYSEIGRVVAYVSASDPDSGDNGQTSCSLNSNEFKLVKLDDEGKYKVELMSTLDREIKDLYNITLTCFDNGLPPLKATADFSVKVLDENDHEPVFSLRVYEATVYESNTIGAFITQLTVTDADIGHNANLSFQIFGTDKHYFNIDETGKVIANIPLDREYSDKIVATIVATDKGIPALSSSATLTVNLLDINDVSPAFSQKVYVFEVEEGQPGGTLAGILEASDTDLGINKEIFYFLQNSSNEMFYLEASGMLRTKTSLDREINDVFSLIVLAIDNGLPPLTGTASVIINVKDINDNNPYFIYPSVDNNTLIIPHTVETHQKIASVQAHDLDSGLNSRIIYSLSSVNTSLPFVIDPTEGTLFIKDQITESEIGMYALTIMANDQGSKQQRGTQIPLYIHIYFDNSTIYLPVESAALSKDIITVLIVIAIVLLVAFIIAITVLCIRRHTAKRKLKGTVPNSASTSSTAKLQAGYYIAPGVRESSSSFACKQEEGTCNSATNSTRETTQTNKTYIVVRTRPETELPPEIVEICINGYQNGLSGTLERSHIDDDRFSTFRSQEDILTPSLRYGSLRRQEQDNSSRTKRSSDTLNDLSCDESASDSGRGGSDVDVNNGAAALKLARTKAGTPISIKSGISHQLSPLPQHEKTLTTFRGDSPNYFKFDSDSETLQRNSQQSKSSSSAALSSPNYSREIPKFGSGSASAFSNPAGRHISRPEPVHQPYNPSRSDDSDSTITNIFITDGFQTKPAYRQTGSDMSLSNSTYPRPNNEPVPQGLNPSHSLTRRNPVSRQIPYPATGLTHHTNDGGNRNTLNNQNVKDHSLHYNHFEPGRHEMPTNRNQATTGDVTPHDDSDTYNDSIDQVDYIPDNALNTSSDSLSNNNLDYHSSSVEEDFLLPPYPEVDTEDMDTLDIHPGYTDFSPDMKAEKAALFSNSRFESDV